MSRLGWLNLLLALLLLGLVAAHGAIPSDPTRRNLQYFPNMVNSLAHEAQAAPPVLDPDRNIDLRPPEGAVARGHLPLGYEATPEEATRAGLELSLPDMEDDADSDERGAFVYTTFCATCHGPGGEGDGPVTRKGVPPPPSLLLEHSRDLPDGQMFHIITFGQGNMAAYGPQVGRADRWEAVRHIRRLQEAGSTP
ncbi:MAG: cytochrome c [Acidobacteria bacterium]|uniref:Cytochrome c n=1 Tax=Candidatus Polarisedimenticola svalbardensis TaxID=2886004 RepID=A0A8J6Y2Q1_9BACT|nr:cytochrome c [Candidatus Polarisedimenticola svalbardensis]